MILGIVAVAGLLILIGFNNNYVRQRLTSAFDFQNGSVASRILFWQGSWDAIKSRPLLGYGLENQGEALTKDYQTSWGIYGNVNAKTNRAHNLFLDLLLTGGVILLLAYFWLIISFFKKSWQNIKSQSDNYLSLALLTGMNAYLISLFFGFSFVASQVYFWTFLALVSAANIAVKPRIVSGWLKAVSRAGLYFKQKLSQKIIKPLSAFFTAIILIAVGGLLVWQVNYEFKTLIADHYFAQMQEALVSNQDFFTAFVLYGYIKEENIHDEYYDQQFVRLLYNYYFDAEDLSVKETGKIEVRVALKNLSAPTGENLLAQARGQIILHNYDAAAAALKILIARTPGLPENYLYLGDLESQFGHLTAAQLDYNLALARIPETADPKLNDQHLRDVKTNRAQIYKKLAVAYDSENNFAAARANYILSLDNYFDLGLYKKIADTYFYEHNLDKAIWYNQRGMFLSPGDYHWPYAIASLYQMKGDKKQALYYAQAALSLNSSDKQLQALVKFLK